MTTRNRDHLAALLANLAEQSERIPERGLVPGMEDLLQRWEALGEQRLDEAALDRLEVTARRLCFQNGWFDVLARSGVPQPYDYSASFHRNAAGPTDGIPRSRGIDPTPRWSLLGYSVGYPVGVPASVLTANSTWVRYFAHRGFNVLTYKTVRSRTRRVLPEPNWIYLDDLTDPIKVGADLDDVEAHGGAKSYPLNLHAYSTANSFGVPSVPPETWQDDVRAVLDELGDGKLLILSVMGTYEELEGEELIEDFVQVSRLAEETGAPAIELNLSCPNTVHAEGGEMRPPICSDPETTAEIVRRVRDSVSAEIPLVAKLSYLDVEALEGVLEALAPYVQGISGINTLQARVLDDSGAPVFRGLVEDDARNREFAGISGVALRRLAQDFVSNVYRLKKARGWDYDVIGMGGVMGSHDVRALMALGADAVQTATYASTNPRLPDHLIQPLLDEGSGPRDRIETIRQALLTSAGSFRSSREIAGSLGLDDEEVSGSLADSDLPQAVATLLRLIDGRSSSAPQALNAEIWGPRPAAGAALTHAVVAERGRAGLWRRLVSDSISMAEAAETAAISEDELAKMLQDGIILMIPLDGEKRLPSWQFAAGTDQSDLKNLKEVAYRFPGDLAALNAWIQTPHPDLNDRTPEDAMKSGEVQQVLSVVDSIAAAGH